MILENRKAVLDSFMSQDDVVDSRHRDFQAHEFENSWFCLYCSNVSFVLCGMAWEMLSGSNWLASCLPAVLVTGGPASPEKNVPCFESSDTDQGFQEEYRVFAARQLNCQEKNLITNLEFIIAESFSKVP